MQTFNDTLNSVFAINQQENLQCDAQARYCNILVFIDDRICLLFNKRLICMYVWLIMLLGLFLVRFFFIFFCVFRVGMCGKPKFGSDSIL